MAYTIKPYQGESLDLLNELILRSKASWGYADEMLTLQRDGLTVTEATLKKREFFLGWDDKRLVLLYSLSARSPASCELEDCWIDPALRGRGLGRAIFEHVRIQMARHGWETMRIESDPFAAGFYLKMGARQIGETPSKPEGRMLPVLEWRPDQ